MLKGMRHRFATSDHPSPAMKFSPEKIPHLAGWSTHLPAWFRQGALVYVLCLGPVKRNDAPPSLRGER